LTESELKKIFNNIGTEDNSKAENRLSLGVFNMICKCFNQRNKKIKYYLKSNSYIIDKLSVENILKTFVNFDVFKKILLNECQLRIINLIPKQTQKKLKNIDSNNYKDFIANLPIPEYLDMDNDEISRKLMNFHK